MGVFRLASGGQAVLAAERRRRARLWDTVTAAVAASSAAAAARRVICQPDMPPLTTGWARARGGRGRRWYSHQGGSGRAPASAAATAAP
jgi:hypothetical protein